MAIGSLFSATPTAQNSPELHFHFSNSFIQLSLLRSLISAYLLYRYKFSMQFHFFWDPYHPWNGWLLESKFSIMFGSLKRIGFKSATVRWRGGLGCGGNNRLPSRSFLAPFVFTGNLPKLRGAATAAALLSSWSMPIDLLLCVYYQSGKSKQCSTHFQSL